MAGKVVYTDIEDGEVFDTIEEALLTSCHLCGSPLEWALTVVWNDADDKPEIHGESFSCGVTFNIRPIEEGYETLILKKT
jgi:hypothetical protein